MGWRERQQERRKQIWMGVLMAVLMIFSAFGVYLGAVSDPNEQLEDKGIKFMFKDGKYLAKVNKAEISFYHLPSELELVNLSPKTVDLLQKAWVVQVTFDPAQEGLEYVELTRFDWQQWWDRPLINGVVQPSKLYPHLPVLSCANATANGPVIFLNVSPTFSSRTEGNCLILEGLGIDFLRWRDRILYLRLRILDKS